MNLRVYYDGNCPICRGARSWTRTRDRAGRVEFVDFRKLEADELPAPLSELEAKVGALDSDGSLRMGYEAWLAIIALLPRWRHLAPWFRLPPLSWLGRLIYRVIAANRFRLAGLLDARCEIEDDKDCNG